MPKEPKDTIPSTSFLNLPVPPSWKSTDQLNAYESWVYTAINAIAHEVASIDFRLYKKKVTRGEVDIEEIYEHEALSLLDGVNPYSNKYNHLFETVVYLELLGEAYWAVMRDARKRPVSMWQLRPDKVTIHPSQTKVIDHYSYSIGTEEYILETENVIPFRFVNPNQPYRGKSPVQSVAMAIDTDKFSADWNRKFFYNSALPNMVFTTDQNLTQQQVDRLIANWQNKFQGRDNAHKVAFMTAGFTPHELGQNIRDMDFAEQRRALRDEILGVFKVPKTVIGLTDDVNRANAEATNSAFMQRTVSPIIKMMVSYLNEFYLKMWGDDSLFFDYDDPSPEDVDAKLRYYENGLKYGWLTINEVREQENLDPVDGGDAVYIPFGTTQLKPAEPDESPEDSDNDDGGGDEQDTDSQQRGLLKLPVIKSGISKKKKLNTPIPHKSLSQLRNEEIEKEIDSSLVKLIQMAMKPSQKKKSVDDKKMEFKETYWKAMIEKTDVQEAFMKEKLVDLFIRQREEVLRKVSNMKDVKRITRKTATRDLLFDTSEWNDEFKEVFHAFISGIVEERATEVIGLVGGRGVDLTTQSVLNFLNKEGLLFVKQLNETTRDKLIDKLSEGIKNGEGIDELSTRVKSVYEEATTSRAQMIARTEVLRATNFATEEAYSQSGVVKKKEWLTALDERTCEYCDDLDGTQISLDNNFNSSIGKIKAPPLHPSCRCTLIPVIESKSFKKVKPKDINRLIEKKVLLLNRLAEDIEQIELEINGARDEARKIKDEALREAEEQKQEILQQVKQQAEMEKEQTLKELKDLRYKVARALKDGRK